MFRALKVYVPLMSVVRGIPRGNSPTVIFSRLSPRVGREVVFCTNRNKFNH